jgi:hypothetical protein
MMMRWRGKGKVGTCRRMGDYNLYKEILNGLLQVYKYG